MTQLRPIFPRCPTKEDSRDPFAPACSEFYCTMCPRTLVTRSSHPVSSTMPNARFQKMTTALHAFFFFFSPHAAFTSGDSPLTAGISRPRRGHPLQQAKTRSPSAAGQDEVTLCSRPRRGHPLQQAKTRSPSAAGQDEVTLCQQRIISCPSEIQGVRVAMGRHEQLPSRAVTSDSAPNLDRRQDVSLVEYGHSHGELHWAIKEPEDDVLSCRSRAAAATARVSPPSRTGVSRELRA